MRLLVRRYVTAEQRKRDDFGITEDDVMEIRQDISTLRYELIDILRTNGMKTPVVDKADLSVAGKKGKMMERRILKDFQIGIVEGIVNEVVQGSKEVKDVFSSIAKAIGKKASGKAKKEDWNEVVRKSTVHRDPIGSTRASIVRRDRRSLKKHILEQANQGLQMDTDMLVQYNPKLSDVAKGTRVAYVKFMANALKDGKGGVKIVDEKSDRSRSNEDDQATKSTFKSIIKTKIMGVPGAGDTPSHVATPSTTTAKVEVETKKATITEDAVKSVPPVPSTSTGAPQVPKPQSPTPTTSRAAVDEKPKEDKPKDEKPKDEKPKDEKPKDEKPKDEKPKGDKQKDDKPVNDKPKEEKPKEEKPKDEKPKDEKPKEDKPKEEKQKSTVKKESLKPPEPTVRPVTPTGERGKSKTTGKTISGWL